MNRNKLLLIAFLVLLLILYVVINKLTPSITFEENKTDWIAETIVAETTSPDGMLYSKIVTTDTNGKYLFEVKSVNKVFFKQKFISAPTGYHSHNVILSWDILNSYVIGTIDHDFGDGNIISKISFISDK